MAVKNICLIFSVLVSVSAHKLEQVLILSRHNIRAPLSSNLEKFSQNPWPQWKQSSFLTEKGGKLEGYMGEYIYEWLQDERLLPQGCPDNQVHIYANTRQRTRESAVAFTKAFACNVTVHSINSNDMDPIFNPIIRNDSNILKAAVINEMQHQLDELDLDESYKLLEDILDLENSMACKNEGICSFLVKDKVFYEVGEEPNVIGPLAYANSIVDSFLMSYYEGMDEENVAWGRIKNVENWKLLAKITKENQNVRFNSTILAKEVAKPLLDYILNIFENATPKFTLLHGHDANLNSVMAAIGFKSYVLPDQYETTPLGGKLVFQKRSHGDTHLFQAHFVYPTTQQLREGAEMSKKNPPKWVQLDVGCDKDKNGFCLWDDFMKIMRSIYK